MTLLIVLSNVAARVKKKLLAIPYLGLFFSPAVQQERDIKLKITYLHFNGAEQFSPVMIKDILIRAKDKAVKRTPDQLISAYITGEIDGGAIGFLTRK